MITPSSSSPNRTPFSQSLPAAGQPASSARVQQSDQLSTKSISNLKAALESEPAVRPEMLARARALVADSGHPSEGMLKSLAQHLLSTPDLSAD